MQDSVSGAGGRVAEPLPRGGERGEPAVAGEGGSIEEGWKTTAEISSPASLVLDPGWTPQSLAPSARYVASAGIVIAPGSTDRVTRWVDQSGNGRDAVQVDAVAAMPQFRQHGWDGTPDGDPAVTFSGGQLMHVGPWSGAPLGLNAGFTVLAVMRSARPQDSGVVSWWDVNGGGVAWAGTRASGQQTLPELLRNHEAVWTQPYAGPHDLGTGHHVIVWRYAPDTQTLKVTVDGTASSSTPFPRVAELPSMPLFIGARTPLPTGFFSGDVSELVIVPTTVSDENVQNFTAYARITWGSLPEQWSTDPCRDANDNPTADGTRCDDGNASTYGDRCSSGSCIGAPPLPGSPAELSPIAWYHAGTPEVMLSDGRVAKWFDRTTHHLDLLEGFYEGRPSLVTNAWLGTKPAIRFSGMSALRRDAWTGIPGGSDAPFSVLAVIQSATSRNAALASWWNRNGGGSATCQFLSGAAGPTLDLYRADDALRPQDFPDARPVNGGRHVLAWRYSSGTAKLTADGATVSVSSTALIGSIGATEFLVGAANDLSSILYQGDIAELAVIPTSISDAQLASFQSYAQAEWGGLTLRTASGGCELDAWCTGTNQFCDNGTCRTRSCNLNDPFGSMTRVLPGVTSVDGFALAPDGLTGWFSAISPSTDDIFVATRSTATSPFGSLTNVPNVNTGSDDSAPFLSSDGLRLYFYTRAGGSADLVSSTRSTLTSVFPTPQPIPGVNSAASDEDPTLSEDEQTLLFASDRPTGDRFLYMTDKSGGSFGTPQRLDLGGGTWAETKPVLSRNGLRLYFRSNRPGVTGDHDGDIWMAERGARNTAFGASAALDVLNWSGTDFPVGLSADGCTLYLASNREHGASNTNAYEVYQAHRQATPDQVTVHLNVTGGGAATVGNPFNCSLGNSGTCTVQRPFGTKTVTLSNRSGARWSGVCGPNGPNPSTDGIVPFTLDGTCNVSYPATSGQTCADTVDCATGLFCNSGLCGASCTPSCDGKMCGAPNGCGTGTCPCGTRSPGQSCTISADCSGGLACASGICGGEGAGCGQCAPGLVCQNGSCGCTCDGVACGDTNACGDVCLCGSGVSGCTADSDCKAGLTCTNGTCVGPDCVTNPVLAGCGYPGAPCGACVPNPFCASDADCPSGLVCPEDNGSRYFQWGKRVCEDPRCSTTPETVGCGTPTSPCGLCPGCAPQCADKHCGDADLSDGCGGTCTGLCTAGDPSGCSVDSDCVAGDVCMLVVPTCNNSLCARVCRPADPCARPDLAPPNCGSASAVCGPTCPISTRSDGVCSNAGRVCGDDPVLHISCGSCGSGQFCTATGHCAPLAADAAIEVPAGDGPNPPVRVVTPLPSPSAAPLGTIPGQFAVNDRGSATYRLALELPPGRAGLQPELGLTYVSGAPNGAVGLGWQIDGLSEISACNKTYALDGAPAVPNGFDALRDAYCLDGQRLIPIASSNAVEFRTAVDTFNKIVATLGGDGGVYGFKVYAKDGRILTYGGYPSSALARVVDGTSSFQTYALASVADRAGNFIRYTYLQIPSRDPAAVFGTAELVPDAISYTGHGTSDGDREVVFHYDNRGDAMVGYAPGGAPNQRTKLLKTIEVRAQGQLVRRYELTHELTSFQERLRKVQEAVTAAACGDAGAICKPPTTFDYFDEKGDFEAPVPIEAPHRMLSVWGGSVPLYPVGPVGVVHRWAPEDGWNHRTPQIVIQPALERRSDRISAFTGGVQTITTVTQPIPGAIGFGLSIAGAYTDNPVLAAGSVVVDFINNIFGEEKKEEEAEYGGYTYSPLFKDQNVASDYDNDMLPFRSLVVGPTGGERVSDVFHESRWLIDLDGDGVDDKVTCRKPTTLSLVGSLDYELANAKLTPQNAFPRVPVDGTHETSTGTLPMPFDSLCICGPASTTCKAGPTLTFDVDGDGVSNLVAFDTRDDQPAWAVLVESAPGSFTWDMSVMSALNGLIDPETHYILPADVNGDGLRDLLALSNETHTQVAWGGTPVDTTRPAYVAINTGKGFSVRLISGAREARLAPRLPPHIVDLDHDGVEEILEMDQPVEESPLIGRSAPPPPLDKPQQWYLRRLSGTNITRDAVPGLVAPYGSFGDFDGDGNLDLLTLNPFNSDGEAHRDKSKQELRRGTGRRNGLLQSVTDGLGHHVEVKYDNQDALGALVFASGLDNFDPGAAPTDPSCRWPYRCSERVHNVLVSSHVESHYLDTALAYLATDRGFEYHYKGTRDDVAGYGWLGLWEREISMRDYLGVEVKHTKIEYEPPRAFVPGDGALPYYHVLTGLVRETTESDAGGVSPLSGLGESLETTRYTSWLVGISDAGRPYPQLIGHTKTVRGGQHTSGGSSNEIIYREGEGRTYDEYGNVKFVDTAGTDFGADGEGSSGWHREQTREYERGSSFLDNWLVGLVTSDTLFSQPRCSGQECVDIEKERHTTYDYYPDTGLLHFMHHEPDDVHVRLDTELERLDPYGNVTAIVKSVWPTGERRTAFSYDSRGLFRLSTTQVGENQEQTSQFRYDDRFGTTTVSTDPNGIDSTSSYDEFGLERIRTDATGTVTTDYSALSGTFGYEVTQTGVGGPSRATKDDYDSFGHLVARTDTGIGGDPVYEEFVYDGRQRLQTRTRPHLAGDATQGEISYTYDDLDRVLTETRPDGGLLTYGYSLTRYSGLSDWQVPGAAFAVTTTETTGTSDPSPTTTRITSADGHVMRVIDALGGTTDYTYGAFGEIRRITDPAGREIVFENDAWSHATSVTDAARGGTEYSEYNAFGELEHTEDAAQRKRDLYYDDFGRIDTIVDLRSSLQGGDLTTRYYYDGDGSRPNEIGRLIRTQSPGGQRTEYSYEAPESTRNRGLVKSVTEHVEQPLGPEQRDMTTDYHYDDSGNVDGIDYPEAFGQRTRLIYDFDGYGHLSQVRDANHPSYCYWRLVTPDEGYRIKEARTGTDCADDAGGNLTSRTYDPHSGKLETVESSAAGVPIHGVSYEYDLAGRVTKRQEAQTVVEYRYDALGRLTHRDGVRRYSYDPAGTGRLTKRDSNVYTYETAGRDWIQTAGEWSYTHDAVGNVATRNGPGVSQTFDYTPFDLPSKITSNGADTHFQYRADHQRAVKEDDQALTFYAGKHHQVVLEQNGSEFARSFVFAGGEPIAEVRIDASGAVSRDYLFTDSLGTVGAAKSAGAGTTSSWTYTAFGEPVTGDHSQNDTPYGFTGQEGDWTLGLMNYNARIYDPVLGQFLQADPTIPDAAGDGLNRYAYVKNSPLNFTDPSGMSWFGDTVGRLAEAVTLAYVGGHLAGEFGFGLDKGLAIRAGAVNGAFTGYRHIYSLDSTGFASFVADSTWGIMGTALGDALNLENVTVGAAYGLFGWWQDPVYSAQYSTRQNSQVYLRGFHVKGHGHKLFAHTQGNVTSALGEREDEENTRALLAHEREHVLTNRLFGPIYTTSYAIWLVGGAIASPVVALTNHEKWGRALVELAYYSNPWEARAYCDHNPDSWHGGGKHGEGAGFNMYCGD